MVHLTCDRFSLSTIKCIQITIKNTVSDNASSCNVFEIFSHSPCMGDIFQTEISRNLFIHCTK